MATRIEWAYRLSLSAKAALGLGQFVGGLGLQLSPAGEIVRFVDWMTRNQLARDPDDLVLRKIAHWAGALSPGAENFYSIYLLGHGLLNFGVVVALLLRLRGAYHLSLTILTAFVAYQLYDFVLSGDPALLVLTAIDILVIALVLLERRQSLHDTHKPRRDF